MESITESRWSHSIKLNSRERDAMTALGRQLARGTGRHGEALTDSNASLVRLRPAGDGGTQLYVDNAVGVIGTPTVQIVVTPKIPAPHLLHILDATGILPQFASGVGRLEAAQSLPKLICSWFVASLERVIEEGLARDYRPHRDELTAIRGRIAPLDTARLIYRGRLAAVTEYEEYDFDTPLNRLLLQAAKAVAAGTVLPEDLRKRARRAASRMDGVGQFQRADVHAELDRRTVNYSDARSLARQVLFATGRTLAVGDRRSWTFLFRTPELVEAGIRTLVAQRLALRNVRVQKSQLRLGPGITVNPDLVFRAPALRAIGDVKYKLGGTEWNRGDLYEVVAFATAFGTKHSVVILFGPAGVGPLDQVTIGDQVVTPIYWPAHPALSPEAAADQFTDSVEHWFAAVPQPGLFGPATASIDRTAAPAA